MHAVTSLRGSAVSGEELSAIVADYVALDRVRIFRRLLVQRFGVLALLAIVIDLLFRDLSQGARWVPLTLFLIPPAWAWIAELRLEYRLATRLDAGDESATKQQPRHRTPSPPDM